MSSDQKLEIDEETETGTKFDFATAMQFIPEFFGDSENLDKLLNIIEFMHDDLKDDTERKKLIKFVVKIKLRTRRLFVDPPETFDSLKALLLDIYKSYRMSCQIRDELMSAYQGHQKLEDYAEKMESLVAELIDVEISEIGESSRRVIAKINDQLGLECFKRGINESLKLSVVMSQPKTLREAVKRASETAALNEYQRVREARNNFQSRNNRKNFQHNNNRKQHFRRTNAIEYGIE